jgi:putative tricarboxylic transport membrane protein
MSMAILQPLANYFQSLAHILSDPVSLAIMFGSVLLGIIFGALPGLTSTLGVALLTAITYGLDAPTAMVCLLSIYVGGTYGGSYSSILINIPGTAASAATALDGYPLALKGGAGRAIGLGRSLACCSW